MTTPTYRNMLASFTLDTIPFLDDAVYGALELFEETAPPALGSIKELTRPLVFGSENALATGRIIFSNRDAVFGDENNYMHVAERFAFCDGAVLISASGGKHAVTIAQTLQAYAQDKEVWLLTNNPEAPAMEFISKEHTLLFPKNREPYTYNVSTYLGMILAHTGERAKDIHTHLEKNVAPLLMQQIPEYSAYCFLVPARFEHIVPMIRTKFDELFGPKLMARVFTVEQAKHAKTVVSSEEELFISLGEENAFFGAPHRRLTIPLPEGGKEGACMATAYVVVGSIMRAYPPYFKDTIEAYCRVASNIFGENIEPIVS